jgi:hypothetical protein
MITVQFYVFGGLAAASAFIDANTAHAFRGFAAVGANTTAIINKVTASAATRLNFISHTVSPPPQNTLPPQRFKRS